MINNCIIIHIIPNTLNEEDINLETDEIVNDKDFENPKRKKNHMNQ